MKKLLLLSAAIVMSFSMLFSQSSDNTGRQTTGINDDMVAFYNFDDGTANDASGNGHNGTVYGSVPMVDWANGKHADFNGNYNNYIKVLHHPDLNFSDDFSISLWTNQTTATGISTVLAKGRDILSNYTIRLGGNNFLMCYDGVYGHWVSLSSPRDQDMWHHVVGVADQANHLMNLYIDGVLVDSKPLPAFNITTTFPLVIGRHFTYSYGGSAWPYPFMGKVDEIRIYSKALSDSEIQQLYNLNDPNGGPDPSVPLNNWAIIGAIFLIITALVWRRLSKHSVV